VVTCVRYATALDTRDWGLLSTCFAEDAVAEYGEREPCQGYPAIEEVCRVTLTPLDRDHGSSRSGRGEPMRNQCTAESPASRRAGAS